MTERPSHLADFNRPPLNEVVLGVQFAQVPGYHQIQAGEVRDLFKDRFPGVQDHPAIPPAFEVFGINDAPSFGFNFVQGGQHDRFFFISEDGNELIQFQQDRLLHNWRKNGISEGTYPRFEAIVSKFEEELSTLQSYFRTINPQDLEFNQAELTYINFILFGDKQAIAGIADAVKVLQLTAEEADEASFTYRRALHDEFGNPFARLYGEANTLRSTHGDLALSLSFTVRGAPAGNSIRDCIDFLKIAREVVINEFEAVTTDSAQAIWGKVE